MVPDVVIHSTQSNSSISCNDSIYIINLQQPSNVKLMQCASQKTALGNSPLFEYSLKTKDRQFDNVVFTGVITTTYGATNDDKVVKLMTFCFQCSYDFQ